MNTFQVTYNQTTLTFNHIPYNENPKRVFIQQEFNTLENLLKFVSVEFAHVTLVNAINEKLRQYQNRNSHEETLTWLNNGMKMKQSKVELLKLLQQAIDNKDMVSVNSVIKMLE